MKYIKKISLIAAFLVVSASLFAQRNYKLGNMYYERFDFIQAIDHYKKVLENDPDHTESLRMLAQSYVQIRDFHNSERIYKKLVKHSNDNPEYIFQLAQSLRANKKYDEALSYYNGYMQAVNKDFVASITGNGFDYVSGLREADPNIAFSNASNLNSAESDFGVSFLQPGEVVFCSTRPSALGTTDNWTHAHFADLYQARVTFDGQQNPSKFKKDRYNGVYHDGPVFFYDDEVYLTRSNYLGKRVTRSKDDKTVMLQLYQLDDMLSKVDKGDYKEAKLPFNSKEYSVAHAAVSPDGKTLVFSSDASSFEGHLGGTDLYMCTRKKVGDTWSEPKNLGSTINTPADEEYPFFESDNRLVFASNGLYGLGGLDIYYAVKENGEWQTPVNMKAPFNSSYDDFNYIYDATENLGFLSSNRKGGQGSDDIYTFRYTEDAPTEGGPASELNLFAYDVQSMESLPNVKITMPDCYDKELVTDANGRTSAKVADYTACKLIASAEGYYPKEVPFTMLESDKELALEMTPMVPEDPITLEVCVYDRVSNVPVPQANIMVINERTGHTLEAVTDSQGCVMFPNIEQDACYRLVANKATDKDNQRYLSTSGEVCSYGVESPAMIQKSLYLNYAEINKPLVSSNRMLPDGVLLPIIYYDLDKFDIRRDAAAELNYLMKIMRDNPSLKIKAVSHTDCRNDMSYNMNLSKNRAIEAVDYLVEKGIASSRLSWDNKGESQLVNDCACECEQAKEAIGLAAFRSCEDKQWQASGCTEQDHQLNRRTEFVVVSF